MWLLIDSPNTNLFGPQFFKNDDDASSSVSRLMAATTTGPIPSSSTTPPTNNTIPSSSSPQSFNPLSPALIQATPLGRYAAPKPTCSMGQVNLIEKLLWWFAWCWLKKSLIQTSGEVRERKSRVRLIECLKKSFIRTE